MIRECTDTVTTMSDIFLLQNDLKKIYNWSKLNNLTFNDTKLQHISFASDETIYQRLNI